VSDECTWLTGTKYIFMFELWVSFKASNRVWVMNMFKFFLTKKCTWNLWKLTKEWTVWARFLFDETNCSRRWNGTHIAVQWTYSKFLPSKDVGMSFNLEKSLEHPMPILNQEHKFADPAPVTINKWQWLTTNYRRNITKNL